MPHLAVSDSHLPTVALDQVKYAYFLLDHDFRYVFFNREAERVAGIDRSNLLGRCVWDLYPEILGTVVEKEYRRVNAERISSSFENRLGDRWFQEHVDPIDGGIIVGFHEITRQKQLQEELARSKDIIAMVSESGLIGSFRWSVQDDETIASPEIYALFGLEPEYAKHDSSFWFARMHPEDSETMAASLMGCIAERKPSAIYEFRARQADRSYRWLQCRTRFRYDDDGRPLVMVGVTIDLSQRKELEDQLRRRVEELEALEEELQNSNGRLLRSNDELQRFAYVVAHDLQAPLRTVSSMTELIARRLQGKLDDDCVQMAGHIRNSASQMSALIADLLDYSTLSMDAPAPLRPVDCALLLEQTQANLQILIAETGARITVGPLPTVLADDQLIRVFQNLIENAIKYRSESTPEVDVSADRDGDNWKFSVRDNGIGFEMRHAEKIFEVFQRLHSALEYEGTGIGLATCRKLMERYGGRLSVHSQPGVGSTFYFTIPADPALDC